MQNEIDQYVNSVYDGLGQTKEVSDLREEMRNHLLQTAKDLQSQGHTEEESIQLAIERFGDSGHLRRELDTLYEADTMSSNSSRTGEVLAWISLIVGSVSFLSSVYAILSVPLGIIGLVLGVISRKGKNRRIAIWGMVLSAVAILLTIFLRLLLMVHSVSVTPVQIHSSSQPIQTNHS